MSSEPRNAVNLLTGAQLERLALVAEECAEVIQVIGKILRHGYNSTNPNAPAAGTNRAQLEREVGQLTYALDLLGSYRDVQSDRVLHAYADKRRSIHQWLHYEENTKAEA